jgi:hypothetical protein
MVTKNWTSKVGLSTHEAFLLRKRDFPRKITQHSRKMQDVFLSKVH